MKVELPTPKKTEHQGKENGRNCEKIVETLNPFSKMKNTPLEKKSSIFGTVGHFSSQKYPSRNPCLAPLPDRRPKFEIDYQREMNQESGVPAIPGHVTCTLQDRSCDQEIGSGDMSGDQDPGSCDQSPAWTGKSMKTREKRRQGRVEDMVFSAEKRKRKDVDEEFEDEGRDWKKMRVKLKKREEVCVETKKKMKKESLSS